MPFDYGNQPGMTLLPRRSGKGGPTLISLISGYYNAGKYFEQTFNSVVNQTFPWFEWVIVDDGSTSQADVALLEGFAAREERIRVVRQPNGGLAAARNRALREVRSEIVVPLDTDDLLEPNALECLYWALLAHPGAGWAHTDCVGFDGQHYLWRQNFTVEREKRENLLVATAAIRKKVFDATGGYRVEQGHYYEDWLFWIKAMGLGFRPVHVQGYSFWYRRLGSGMLSGIKTDRQAQDRADRLIREAVEEAAAEAGAPVVQYPAPAPFQCEGLDPAFSWPPSEEQAPAAAPTRAEGPGQPSAQAFPPASSWPALEEPGPCTLVITGRFSGPQQGALALAQKAADGGRVAVAALYPEDGLALQAFFPFTRDCFSLPAFLPGECYGAFLEMLVQTRRVNRLWLDNVPEGWVLAQALVRRFPSLEVFLWAQDGVTRALAAPCTPNAPQADGLLPVTRSLPEGWGRWGLALWRENHSFFHSLLKERPGGLFSSGPACHCPEDFAAGQPALDGQPPLVTVLVPPERDQGRLLRLLRSLAVQTFPWHEVLVLDSGEDGARELYAALTAADPRIRAVPAGQGLAAAAADFVLVPALGSVLSARYLEMAYWGLRLTPRAAWARADAANAAPVPCGLEEVAMTGGAILLRRDFLAGLLPRLSGPPTAQTLYQAALDSMARGLHIPVGAEYLPPGAAPAPAVQAARADEVGEEEAGWVLYSYPRTGPWETYALPQKGEWIRPACPDHDKIHLLLVLPWLKMGGADQFNLDLAAGLDKSRYRVSILTTLSALNDWEDRFLRVTADVYPLADYVPFDDFPAYISYFIQSRRIDVMMVSNAYHGYQLLPWLRTAFPGLAIVDYVHMETWIWRQGGYARATGLFGDALEKTYVCNEATRGVIARHFHRQPAALETVYIGTDPHYYNPALVMPGQVYQRFSIDNTRPIVLFACRLDAQKRPYLMLAVARWLKQQGSDAAFVVVGDGPDEEGMKAYVQQHGLSETVYFAGRADDLRPYYRDAALTLVCSYMEGLSLTTYESMAMATPVVTSNVGGQAELVCDETGAVLPLGMAGVDQYRVKEYPIKEVLPYAQAIQRLLSSPQDLVRRSQKCREKVLRGFTKQAMVQRLDQEFVRLVRSPEAARRRQIQVEKMAQCPGLAKEMAAMAGELAKYECLHIFHRERADLCAERLNLLTQQCSDYRQEIANIKNSALYKILIRAAGLIDRLKGRKGGGKAAT